MAECLSTNMSWNTMKKTETLMEGRHHTQSPTLNGIKCTILFCVQQTRENGVTQQAKKLRLKSFVSMSLLLEVLFSETCNQRWNSEFQFLWIKLPQKSQNVWKLNYAWKHCLWKSEKKYCGILLENHLLCVHLWDEHAAKAINVWIVNL